MAKTPTMQVMKPATIATHDSTLCLVVSAGAGGPPAVTVTVVTVFVIVVIVVVVVFVVFVVVVVVAVVEFVFSLKKKKIGMHV
jgi:hypothetical protein